MTKDFFDYMKPHGKKLYEFFRNHELGIYYDPMMGNLQIPAEDWEPHVQETVLQFIQDNWQDQWTLTYVGSDDAMWCVYQHQD